MVVDGVGGVDWSSRALLSIRPTHHVRRQFSDGKTRHCTVSLLADDCCRKPQCHERHVFIDSFIHCRIRPLSLSLD